MKIVILCGGKGTRLGEVTGNLVPKPMARIGEQPMLWHIMQLYSRQGFNEFILCAGHLSWEIKDYFLNFRARHSDITVETGNRAAVTVHGENPGQDWKVTIAETGLETATAGRIRMISRYLDAGPFMLTYGDGLADIDLAKLKRFHVGHGKLATMTGVVPPGRFGELKLEGDQVVDWVEKPVVVERYINGGFMILEREFIDRFIALQADTIMLEHEPLIEATKAGELMLYRHGGFWQCMDTARDWQLLNALWEGGKAPWLAA